MDNGSEFGPGISKPAGRTPPQPDTLLNSIFVVHGRDDNTKQKVAQFLKDSGLNPVILHEQPNMGRTIIEKFKDYSSAAKYAVILLTHDDIGALKSEPDKMNPRARQNVIFEMGHFIGGLGRDKVCVLLDPKVEKPSDIEGILYIELDLNDEWKKQLLQELNAAGLNLQQELGNNEKEIARRAVIDAGTNSSISQYQQCDQQRLNLINSALKTDRQRLALLAFLHPNVKRIGNDLALESSEIKKFANIMAKENDLRQIQDIGGVLSAFTQQGDKRTLDLLRKGRQEGRGSVYNMDAEWLPYLHHIQKYFKWQCSWLES